MADFSNFLKALTAVLLSVYENYKGANVLACPRCVEFNRVYVESENIMYFLKNWTLYEFLKHHNNKFAKTYIIILNSKLTRKTI